MNSVILDVRERDEYDSEHIPGAINVPLSHFTSTAPGVLTHFEDRKVVLICRSGKRAELALHQARLLGFAPQGGYQVFDGGILQWKKLGNQTISKKGRHLPILRQVHLVAGSLVLLGAGFGYLLNPGFYALSAFVGAGLVFAGATGTCLMAEILGKMPWNRKVGALKEEVCTANTGVSSCGV